MRFATRAIHVGQDPDPATGATIPPVHFTTTYTQARPGAAKGFEYSRTSNPTRQALEKCLAALEGGAEGRAFASGMAATCAILSTLSPGDSVVAYSDMYGGTYRLMETVFRRWGLDPRYTGKPGDEDFEKLCDASTRLIWVETPTNPLLKLIDIERISRIARKCGARLAVDNTFATPALQQPIALGADYVVHSNTKYLSGHSDVVGGSVIVGEAEMIEPIQHYLNAAGACPGPMDCYLTQRGIKTLAVRMRAHCENAQTLAERLLGHPALDSVIHPGLIDHPDHELCRRQMRYPGGIVTIVLKGGMDAVIRFCERLKVFACAESLGAVESLACHPATMTHASIPKDVREKRGVVDSMVRLSVGIEDVDDLVNDVCDALG